MKEMKKMKGGILRKLKAVHTPSRRSGLVFNTMLQPTTLDREHKNQGQTALTIKDHCISDTLKDVKDEKIASGPNAGSNQKLVCSVRSKEESPETAISSGVKPNKFLAVTMHDEIKSSKPSLEIIASSIVSMESPSSMEDDHEYDNFIKEKCPPGGENSVILYTTSLRGIRKTFEDCSTIKFLLDSFRVLYYERDVSMHLEYREEMWRILGERIVPPRLFVRGRYIGGADEVVGLHEKGMLINLFQGIPLSPSSRPCKGCAGMRFVLCTNCNGSRKVFPEVVEDGTMVTCPDCNENGLTKCSVCNQQ